MSIHVTKHSDGWQVKKSKGEKAFRVVATQEEAITIAKEVAKNQNTDIKIHSKKGYIRAGVNYSGGKKKEAASAKSKEVSKKELKQKEKQDKKAAKLKAKDDKKAAKQKAKEQKKTQKAKK